MSGFIETLSQGQPVHGVFAPQGLPGRSAAGVLSWSQAEGAQLDLVGSAADWPTDFGVSFVIHGTPDEGDPFTLIGARPVKVRFPREARRVVAPTVVVGEHIDGTERWTRGNFRYGSLLHWRTDNGFDFSHEHESGFTLTWTPPSQALVEIDADTELALHSTAPLSVRHAPDWSFANETTATVRVAEGKTIDEFRHDFGIVLLGFGQFVVDAPDSLVYESYFDPTSRRGVQVLRQGGQSPYSRTYYPEEGDYLVLFDQLPDPAEVLRRWFEIWHKSRPSLGLFGDVIAEGNRYSVPRFLTLFTAAESYWKTIHGQGHWRVDRLLQASGVRAEVVGATKESLGLIGASRRYHAHLQASGKFTSEQIVESTFESTRRLHAIFQALLLRDLGLDVATTESLIAAHYRSWPIP